MIGCVVNFGTASKVLKVAKKYGIKGALIAAGRGTVHNRLLDFLGIYEVRKEIVTMIVERELAAGAIKGISEELEFKKPHHGIAFSIPVSEFTGRKNILASGANESNGGKDSMYKIIYVVVDKGKAEYVMDAANKAGARGGTIINGRGAGVHEVQKLFSVEIEPEKEEVFIIAKAEQKDGIVDLIRAELKIDEPGNGVMFVMDVNEVYGLHWPDETI